MKIPSGSEVRKPSKTLAGVTPIAVMLSPRKCPHGTCLYCPSLQVPQSYTPLSPPVIRAAMLNYSPDAQVQARLKAFKLMNHPTDKIELIIMGGTFLSYPPKYQEEFIKKCYDALNEKTSKNLEQAKKLNEKAKHRCVALCIETRPDFCSDAEISRMLNLGATRVEIGVQAIDDEIYRKVNRGHLVQHVIDATRRLKDAGFKVGYHMMPGLPLSNPKKDLEMFSQLFSDPRFRPDQLKIYPCQVIKGAGLEKLYEKGKFIPYTKEQTENLLVEIYKLVPRYCRIMRIMREIPPDYLRAGTIRIDLRKDVEERIKKENIKIEEIRFREIGFRLRDLRKGSKIDKKLELKITKYPSSQGEEYFLEFVNKENILFGLARLRITDKQAFLRELHVYGKSLELGHKSSSLASQHSGLGKKLLSKAESIAKSTGAKQLAVISGVGVREYYRKLGYELAGEYMVKKLA